MNPRHCTACGADLAEGASFCTSCGSPIEAGVPSHCPSCGAEVTEGASFCTNCGAPVKTGARAARAAAVGPARALLPQIEADVRRREDTDRPLSWVSFGWTLCKRRNEHFARQRSFYSHVIEALRAHGQATNDDRLLAVVERAAVLLDEAAAAEPEKKPGLRYHLIFGYLRLFADFRKHSLRQLELNEVISAALRIAVDPRISIKDESLVPQRSFLTIWLRGMAPEVNKHFARQALAEDQILHYLRALA